MPSPLLPRASRALTQPPNILRTTLPSTRLSSSFAHLNDELTQRRPPILWDSLSPDNSAKLQSTLSAFLPSTWTNSTTFPPIQNGQLLDHQTIPPAHHLVYFNPAIPADKLLPDGTDPLQSPGAPFVRRMWAGGYLNFGPRSKTLTFGGPSPRICVEQIRDVCVKGKPGAEKIFVGIERRFGAPVALGVDEGSEQKNRDALWTDKEEDFGAAELVERRNIVFMRERGEEEVRKGAESKGSKVLKPQHSPGFSTTLHPTPSLLFRYSALTFNAHAIHLDPHYCRTVEGHRDLLFHGPLSLTLLVTQLDTHLRESGSGKRIEYFEYRNVSPLYCNEPVKLCGVQTGENKFEMWAETPEGGYAVKGTAKVGPA